jgi:hypothetical protein
MLLRRPARPHPPAHHPLTDDHQLCPAALTSPSTAKPAHTRPADQPVQVGTTSLDHCSGAPTARAVGPAGGQVARCPPRAGSRTWDSTWPRPSLLRAGAKRGTACAQSRVLSFRQTHDLLRAAQAMHSNASMTPIRLRLVNGLMAGQNCPSRVPQRGGSYRFSFRYYAFEVQWS